MSEANEAIPLEPRNKVRTIIRYPLGGLRQYKIRRIHETKSCKEDMDERSGTSQSPGAPQPTMKLTYVKVLMNYKIINKYLITLQPDNR